MDIVGALVLVVGVSKTNGFGEMHCTHLEIYTRVLIFN
jgi:hypothetical protein